MNDSAFGEAQPFGPDAHPVLIVLNGPSGVGKTSVARRYVARHAMTLILDLDQLRSQLGQWDVDMSQSARVARGLGLVVAAAHLEAGGSVIVPQLLTADEYVSRLREVAVGAGALFAEVALHTQPESSRRRFEERSAALAAAGQLDTQLAILRTRGGLAALAEQLAHGDSAVGAVGGGPPAVPGGD